MFSSQLLFLVAGLYLLVLFVIAFACDKGWLPKHWVRHPFTYVLTLCVYTSAWTIYAAVGYAYHYGFNFLAFFIGVSGVFLLGPVVLVPLLRLARSHQLASLADMFAFRYRSKTAGVLTTLLLVISMLPLLALQLQAVSTSIQVLSGRTTAPFAALWFCLLILVFAILFGTRHLSPRNKNEGLVMAIAFESLLKIVAFAGVALAGVFGVFHGPSGFSQWLSANPEMLEQMYAPLQNGAWHSLILAFFVAAVVMPHMFHMAFTENLSTRALMTASWALPLMMLLIALCVPFILWAALAGNAQTSPDYYVLGVGLVTSPWVALLGYLAGLASASGMLIVTILALSSMCINHLLLPLAKLRTMDEMHAPLLWARRALIAAVLLAAYGYYMLMPASSLTDLGSLSFVAALQFVPGLVGLLLWPGANRAGFVAGIIAGFTIWTITLLLPSLGAYPHSVPLLEWLNLGGGSELQQRYSIGALSLVINALVLIMVSLITHTRPEEREAAETCALDSARRSYRWILTAATVDDFRQALATPLGPVTARRELSLALSDLALDKTETRPYALRRLRDQLESNLSGLLGPAIAHKIIAEQLPYLKDQPNKPEDTQLMEARLERYRDRLSGLAAELDSLRRFHRQTLLEMPVGVISLSDDGEIIGWNHVMEQLTGMRGSHTVGSHIDTLPESWSTPLSEFSRGQQAVNLHCEITTQPPRWLSLHKSRIHGSSDTAPSNGQVIVVEDITARHQLESHLAHNERLASIGRLAAGVAHEIGNPVTAIACLAQNLQQDAARDGAELDLSLSQIMEQTHRISRIVESLVSFSHSGQRLPATAAPQAVLLHDTAAEAISLLQLGLGQRRRHFDNHLPGNLTVSGDAQRLLQVFINLLDNACDACDEGGRIRIEGRILEGQAQVDIEDNGCGIESPIAAALFEPFVTTKPPGKGTGLGLSVVYSIMEEHGGSVCFSSPLENGHGTRARLLLPLFVDTDTCEGHIAT